MINQLRQKVDLTHRVSKDLYSEYFKEDDIGTKKSITLFPE